MTPAKKRPAPRAGSAGAASFSSPGMGSTGAGSAGAASFSSPGMGSTGAGSAGARTPTSSDGKSPAATASPLPSLVAWSDRHSQAAAQQAIFVLNDAMKRVVRALRGKREDAHAVIEDIAALTAEDGAADAIERVLLASCAKLHAELLRVLSEDSEGHLATSQLRFNFSGPLPRDVQSRWAEFKQKSAEDANWLTRRHFIRVSESCQQHLWSGELGPDFCSEAFDAFSDDPRELQGCDGLLVGLSASVSVGADLWWIADGSLSADEARLIFRDNLSSRSFAIPRSALEERHCFVSSGDHIAVHLIHLKLKHPLTIAGRESVEHVQFTRPFNEYLSGQALYDFCARHGTADRELSNGLFWPGTMNGTKALPVREASLRQLRARSEWRSRATTFTSTTDSLLQLWVAPFLVVDWAVMAHVSFKRARGVEDPPEACSVEISTRKQGCGGAGSADPIVIRDVSLAASLELQKW